MGVVRSMQMVRREIEPVLVFWENDCAMVGTQPVLAMAAGSDMPYAGVSVISIW